MSAQQGQIAALGELRAARRRRFVENLDVMEVLYRVYLVVIFGGIGLGVLGSWLDEAPATTQAIADMRDHGPAVLGLVLALGVLMGMRSGARGGPLAIEAAEVQYVLLAPIDRGAALRPAALRQLRVAVLGGAVLGAAVASFILRPLPGSGVEWLACLALFGALLPLCALSAALLASGRRLRPAAATAVGSGLITWSLADLLLGSTTSPATLAGEIGTLPLRDGGDPLPFAALGLAVALFLAGFGILSVGGIALEAARRRAQLTAELRFSASVQDLRAVVLLRRQLAAERPRRQPWLRLGAAASSSDAVWRRGWQSFLRWPLGRVLRVVAIGLVAGGVTAAAWDGMTLLFVLPGALLLIAALDLVEPLAQEADHPTRRDSLPFEAATLIQRHLAPSWAAMAMVLVLGLTAALALGSASTAAGVGAVMLLPTALVLVCAAALSATHDPYAHLLSPGVGYTELAAPVAIAIVAVGVPVLLAREAVRHGRSAVGAAVTAEILMLVIGVAMAWWLGRRMNERAAVTP